MSKRRAHTKKLPGVNLSELTGNLIVLEGPDGSGRSLQSTLLQEWLERQGYPTVQFGLKRSELVGEELEKAMHGNVLCPLTLSLFYATDFFDQLEQKIIPALRAGFVAIADRWIYTLMVRSIARGADREWLMDIFSLVPTPNLIFYLDVPTRVLAERSFRKQGALDYWESGMDLQRSGDTYQCFIKYQNIIQTEFKAMAAQYQFKVVNGNRDPLSMNAEIAKVVGAFLKPPKTRPGSKTRVRGRSGTSLAAG